MMLKDSTAIQQLAEKNMSLFKRIRRWITNFVRSVKKAFEGVSANSREARLLETATELQKRWDDALVGAMERVKSRQSTEAETSAEESGVKFSRRDEGEASSIRDQVNKHRAELNALEPVFDNEISIPSTRDRSTLVSWALDSLADYGYRIEREGFGTIIFDKNRIKTALSYLKTDGELAAMAAVPEVLKYGIDIGTHENHKNRGYPTYTFSAPVVINGERGNMAVAVIQTTGNFYRAHRIFMPDGSNFEFVENKNTDLGPSGGTPEAGKSIQSTRSASANSIADQEPSVKKQSRRIETTSDRELLADAFESVAWSKKEREQLAQYRQGIEVSEFSETKQHTKYKNHGWNTFHPWYYK